MWLADKEYVETSKLHQISQTVDKRHRQIYKVVSGCFNVWEDAKRYR